MPERSHHSRPAGDDYHPWTTYLAARHEARRRGDHRVGTEHLVLALLMEPALAGALDTDLANARARLEALDREALGAVGVVLSAAVPFAPGPDTPPWQAAETPSAGAPAGAPIAGREWRPSIKDVVRAWEGRLPLTPAAKTLLGDSNKEMRRLGGRHLGPRHILAALLELDPPNPAAELFASLGIDRAAVRARLSDL
jgi:hypothetical protein